MKKARAFTLFEMLISMGVFAILLLLLGMVFDAFWNIQRKAVGKSFELEQLQTSLSELRSELRQVALNTNTHHWLNLKIESQTNSTAIYFTVSRPRGRDLSALSFVDHHAYLWTNQTLYQFVKKTSPEKYQSTESSPYNTDSGEDSRRLQDITLAYSNASPYGWVDSLKTLANQSIRDGFSGISNISSFRVLAYTDEGGEPAEVWEDSQSLPRWIEVEAEFSVKGSTNHPRLFRISIPIINSSTGER